jgi:CheY-like chemotaxis protein
MACLTKPLTQAQLRACIHAARRAPCALTTPPPKGKGSGRPPKAGHRSAARILLAEDDTTREREAITMLQNLGYRFDAVGNGQDALWALKRREYDLVMLDFNMKQMDGIETARSIRNRASGVRNHDVPIIGIIPPGANGELQRCMDASMNACIPRPLSPQSLVTAIERQLLLSQPTLSLLPPLRSPDET